MQVSSVSTDNQRHTTADDDGYPEFLDAVRARFTASTASSAPLFTTDAAGLWDAFLDGLPPADRQHYTCNACRRFVDRFGSLVIVNDDGSRVSPFWDADVPQFFHASTVAISRIVRRAKITGVFVSSEPVYGLPVNASKKPPGQWRHLSAVPERARIFRATAIKNADQRAAEMTEEHGMLARGLADYPIATVRAAHALLTGGNLYRSEKCIGVAAWLLALHEALEAAGRNAVTRDALLWRAVATAPAGYCHVRTTMISTLLDDVAASLPFAEIKARFDAKMAPLAYARPQAAPSAGNIAAAEKVIASMEAAGSLARRFARVEEVERVWRSVVTGPAEAPKGGVFSHLLPAAQAPTQIAQPPVTMTWVKFHASVLPNAERIEALVPHGRAGFAALVTAANPDAPPILQWDSAERRNPVSWYVYNGGSTADRWALQAGAWCPVSAVCYQPTMWGGAGERNAHHGKGVLFLLAGAWDTAHKQSGGFFVESLRSEFHAVRATLEAYMMRAPIEGNGLDTATACGLMFQAGAQRWTGATVRVTAAGGMTTVYTLDRWD